MQANKKEEAQKIFDELVKGQNGQNGLEIQSVVEWCSKHQWEGFNSFQQVERLFDKCKGFSANGGDWVFDFAHFYVFYTFGNQKELSKLMWWKFKSIGLMKKAVEATKALDNHFNLQDHKGDETKANFCFKQGEVTDDFKESISKKMHVAFNNPSVNDSFEKMALGFDDLKQENVNVVLVFETKDPEEAKEELESQVKDALAMVEGAHPLGEQVVKLLNIQFCTHNNQVKMAISSNFDMVTEMLQDMEKNFLDCFGDETSFDFHAQFTWGKSIKQMLNGCLKDCQAGSKFDIGAELTGVHLRNLLAGELKKANKEKLRYRSDKYFPMMFGYLFNEFDVDCQLNQYNYDQLLKMSPFNEMRDMEIKDLLNQTVTQQAKMMKKQGPLAIPSVQELLGMFHEHFKAQVKLYVSAPRCNFHVSFATEGIKDVYDVIFPAE